MFQIKLFMRTILLFVLFICAGMNSTISHAEDLCMELFSSYSVGSSRRASVQELGTLVPSLNQIDRLAKAVSQRSSKAQPYLEALSNIQDKLVEQLRRQGTLVQKIDRFDFNGLRIPRISRSGSRQSDERALISTSGDIEVGLARIAPALVIIPTADGGFLNRLSDLLYKRFGVKTILEVGAIDNPGAAAAFNAEGRYLSISLADVLTDAISYQTMHELSHIVGTYRNERASLLKVKVSGGGLNKLMPNSIYSGGFSVDEMYAYPFGVETEMSLWKDTSTESVYIPIHGDKGTFTLIKARKLGHQLMFLEKPEHRIKLLQQLTQIYGGYINTLEKMTAEIGLPLSPKALTATPFMGESLILQDEESGSRLWIDLNVMDQNFSPKPDPHPTLHLHLKNLDVSFEIPIDEPLRLRVSNFLSRTTRGGMPVTEARDIQIWQDIRSVVVKELHDVLPVFLKQTRELKAQLDDAIARADWQTAHLIVKKMRERAEDLRPNSHRDSLSVSSLLSALGI